MPDEVDAQRAATTLAYENAGREITQAFDTLNSNLTLAAGTLGALITVLGAGQLFGQGILIQLSGRSVRHAGSTAPSTLAGIPRLSNISVLLLGAAFPLLVRFFIRATIGYQNLLRFNLIQRSAWDYLSGDASVELPRTAMRLYVQKWRSPETRRTILWGSWKYGFAWVFVVSLIALAWGFVTAPGVVPRLVSGAFILTSVTWEMISFLTGSAFTCTTAAERGELGGLWPQPRHRAVLRVNGRALVGLVIAIWYLVRGRTT